MRKLEYNINPEYKIGDLTRATIQGTKAFFKMEPDLEKRHDPSLDIWSDHEKTAEYMERMANGALEPAYYLNTLPAGAGKTTLIVQFVKALLRSLHHVDVAVIVCVPMLREIEHLIRDMGLAKEQVAVLTSDDEINKLGCEEHGTARVMFTSQQMVGSRLSGGKRFEELECFYYQGKARRVRLWDEAMVPWEEYLISVFDIAVVADLVKRLNQDLGIRLLKVVEEVRNLDSKSTYQFPDIEGEYRVTYSDLQKDVFSLSAADNTQRKRRAARSLWAVSGRTVRVIKDVDGNTAIDWKPNLPEDFLPVIVFDASGRARTMYEYYGKSSGKLEIITTADKKYENLTISILDMAGGKSAWRKDPGKRLNAIGAEVNREGTRECLVIHPNEDETETKAGRIPDVSKALLDYLSLETKAPQFLTWGKHKQTNEYKDIDKVIIAGALFYPDSVIENRARAAMGLTAERELEYEKFKDIEAGELKNDLLQAANRGTMRRCIADQCAPMDLYVIASDRSGVPGHLRELFPEARIKRWNPLGEALAGKHGAATEYLLKRFKDGSVESVPFSEVKKAIGIRDSSNFTKQVRDHGTFKSDCREHGIYEVGKGQRKTEFKITRNRGPVFKPLDFGKRSAS